MADKAACQQAQQSPRVDDYIRCGKNAGVFQLLPREPEHPAQRYLALQGKRNYTNTPHRNGVRAWLARVALVLSLNVTEQTQVSQAAF